MTMGRRAVVGAACMPKYINGLILNKHFVSYRAITAKKPLLEKKV